MNEKVIKRTNKKSKKEKLKEIIKNAGIDWVFSRRDLIEDKETRKIFEELYKKQTTGYKLKKIIQKIERTKSREKQRKVRDKPTPSKITTGYNLAKKGGKIKKKK